MPNETRAQRRRRLDSTDESSDQHNGELRTMQNDFTSMKTNLKSVATVLSELQTTVNQISNSLVTVEQKFMQLDADVEDINHHLNKHDDELHELHNKAQENEELRDRIKNIEETLQQLRAHPPPPTSPTPTTFNNNAKFTEHENSTPSMDWRLRQESCDAHIQNHPRTPEAPLHPDGAPQRH